MINPYETNRCQFSNYLLQITPVFILCNFISFFNEKKIKKVLTQILGEYEKTAKIIQKGFDLIEAVQPLVINQKRKKKKKLIKDKQMNRLHNIHVHKFFPYVCGLFLIQKFCSFCELFLCVCSVLFESCS